MPNMTRRCMMGGLAVAILLATLGAIPARSAGLGLAGLARIMSGAGKVTIMEGPAHTSDEATYGFLGSDAFLQAARDAGVRIVANEVPQEFQAQVAALQDAVASGDAGRIDQARAAFRADMQALSSTASDAATADREKQLIMDYVENAARYGISVVFADTIATDAQANGLARQYMEAQAQYGQAQPGSSRQAQLQDKVLALSNAIGTERFSRAVNQPIVASLARYQQARQGNMVVVFGAGHGDMLDSLFREAGYATARVALHASFAGLRQDRQIAAAAGFKYSPDVVLMDTKTFIDGGALLQLLTRPAAR